MPESELYYGGRDWACVDPLHGHAPVQFAESICTRCQKVKPKVFFIGQNRSISWHDPEPNFISQPPHYEASCKECLTDKEIAKMTAPIARFVVQSLYLRVPEAERLLPDAARINAALSFLLGVERPDDGRKKALETL